MDCKCHSKPRPTGSLLPAHEREQPSPTWEEFSVLEERVGQLESGFGTFVIITFVCGVIAIAVRLL